MKPQLCFRYDKQAHKLTYPCYIQPKLDGLRALYFRGNLQSRGRPKEEGKIWNRNVLPQFKDYLAPILPDNIVLDGELYRHGWARQKINSAAAVNRETPSTQSHFIQFHVFDCFDIDYPDIPFAERTNYLLGLLAFKPDAPVQYVPTQLIHDPLTGDNFYRQFKQSGYEGAIYRQAAAPYGTAWTCGNQENRWAHILKRKLWIDEEFTCIGVEEGTGKNTGLVGALVFMSKSGHKFTAGSGLSDLQRRDYMDRPPIGFPVTIKYESLSLDGKPLQPSILAVHDDDF